MVRFHRALLVAATIGISIAASRVATTVSEVGSWLLLAGFASLLIAADLAREVEEAAVVLADSSGVDERTARKDVYVSKHPRLLSAALISALLLTAGGGVAYSLSGKSGGKKSSLVDHGLRSFSSTSRRPRP